MDLDERLTVMEAVLSCERCPLSKTTDPVPFTGASPAKIVVMGDFPSSVDSDKGVPFSGERGALFRSHLTTIGVEESEVGWINAISCFTTSKLGDESMKESVKACHPNRLALLDLFDPQWVLLAGSVALKAIRPDLELTHMRGKPFRNPSVSEAVFFPISYGEKEMAEDLAVFYELMSAEEILPFVSDSCGRCGVDAFYWEDTMVGWGKCPSASCGLPKEVARKLAAILKETDGLPCRDTGCSTPADRHVLTYSSGKAPEQMTWSALSSEHQKLMQVVFTGANKGIDYLVMEKVMKKSKVALDGDLDRLNTLGWVLPPEVDRMTWVMSPRGRSAMEEKV